MISRPTLIAALVVVELAIVGLAANALGAGHPMAPPTFAFGAPGPVNPSTTPLDHTFLTGPSPRVSVDIHDVDVTVETGTSPTVRVIETLATHGFLSGRPAPLVAQQTSDGVRINQGDDSQMHITLGLVTHRVRLIVPPGARVELATAGAIDAAGLREKFVAHTSDGSVHVHDHLGDLDVSSDDGRIELVDVHGRAIDATAHDGRIYLTRVGADRLDAHSDDGRIVGEGVRAVDGALTTLDGRILVSFTASSDATATVHTDDGDISVAGFPSLDVGDKHRTVTLGNGHGHFEVSTGDGPITITQGANN